MRFLPLRYLSLPILLSALFAGFGFHPVFADPPADGTNAAAPLEKEVIPPARTRYKGRTIAPFMTFQGANWLIRSEREQEESCAEMLKALNVQPGQTVCDLGCGNGFYTLQLAEMVGEKGKVFAVDIQPEMLHLLSLRAQELKHTNITPILGSVANPKLPAGQVDLILLVDVYHEFSHPEQMLKRMRESLSPKGRIALVEYRKEDPSVPILELHKMSKKQILREYEPNGFKLVEEYDKLPWQHLMFFERELKKDE